MADLSAIEAQLQTITLILIDIEDHSRKANKLLEQIADKKSTAKTVPKKKKPGS